MYHIVVNLAHVPRNFQNLKRPMQRCCAQRLYFLPMVLALLFGAALTALGAA